MIKEREHQGLSFEEVEARVVDGKINTQSTELTPSYKEIVKKNTLTLFNLINTILALALVLVGHIENTLFFGIVIANTALGIIQEVRAKKTLDKLSILAQAQVKVVRNSQVVEISQNDIVVDDLMYLERGDQICADGVVIDSQGLEVDESLLTGEADSQKKEEGNKLLSGSFVVGGRGHVKVLAVGDQSYANTLSSQVAATGKTKSKLLKTIKFLIKIVTIIIIPLGALLFYSSYFMEGLNISTSVLGMAAALSGMIPGGLVVLSGVSMTVGALTLARKKTLVHSLESIETLARVDVLCLDKTGTITDGSLKVDQAEMLVDLQEIDFKRIIAELMGALDDNNPTATALKEKYGSSDTWGIEAKVQFTSEKKWSGVSFIEKGTYLIGSPEILLAGTAYDLSDKINAYAKEGMRVLALGYSQDTLDVRDSIPSDLKPLALLIISDSIRDNAVETFKYFVDEGIELKVISGDNPVTVSRVACEAGIPDYDSYVDMSSVLDDDDYQALVKDKTVFGYVKPQQKKLLIQALQKNGHTTCMTGDGVNDILAMHESDCSVAMLAGNSASRNVADFVLMGDDFASMPNVLREGRRVINNIERIAPLYIVNSLVSVFLTLIYIFLGTAFPYAPLQMTMVNLFTVGVPSFFLALQKNYDSSGDNFYPNIFGFALPAALTIVVNTMYMQLAAYAFDLEWGEFSTAVILLIGLVSFFLLFRVAKPYTKVTRAMLWVMVGAFAIAFLFLGHYFMLESLFSRTALIYLPLIYFSYHINSFLAKIFGKVLALLEVGSK